MAETTTPTAWRGPLLPLNTESGDNRVYQLPDDADVDVRPLPLPLCAQDEIGVGHDGAKVIGRIDRVWTEDGHVWGEGTFDAEDANAMAWARKVADGYAGWVSADFDRIGYRQVARSADGAEVTAADIARGVVADGNPQTQVHTWRIMGATLVSGPAFAEAKIATVDPAGDALTASLTAAGIHYPASDFADPQLPGPTALTVTKGGHVFGHLANWDTCHIGRADRCIRPPASASGYKYFHNGIVDTDAGELPVGKLTLGTGHARMGLGAHAAVAHYDNTGTAVAIIRCGQDQHGIWVAGRILPGVDDARVAELRRSGISGDWRTIRGSLELVAALAVNTPGFPVPRAEALVAGAESALVAAGVVVPGWTAPTCTDPAPELEHATAPAESAPALVASVAQRAAADHRRITLATLDQRMGPVVAARQRDVASLTHRMRSSAATLMQQRVSRAADAPGGRMPPALHKYWTKGEGAAKWVASPHPFDALVTALEATPAIAADMTPEQIKGLAATLYHDVKGVWPGKQRGDKKGKPDAAAIDPDGPPSDAPPADQPDDPDDPADDEHDTDGMIALLPAADSVDALAQGDVDVDELHLTLAYLPDVGDTGSAEASTIANAAAALFDGPVEGEVSGAAIVGKDSKVAVWLINAPGLTDARTAVVQWMQDEVHLPDVSRDFDGFTPHVTFGPADAVTATPPAGPIRFDRLRVSLRGEHTDVPLGPSAETAPDEAPEPVEAQS